MPIRQHSTELGDQLRCSAKVQGCKIPSTLLSMAKKVDEAAAHAITLGFSKESTIKLIGVLTRGYRMLEIQEELVFSTLESCKEERLDV